MSEPDIHPTGGYGEDYRLHHENDEICQQLDSLLRGEISAAETYGMAIDKQDDRGARGVEMLRVLQREHGMAAQTLRDRIRELGGEPSDSSGAWGAWAKLTQGTANLFGDVSSLKALCEGEEHGLKEYNDSLEQLDMTSADIVVTQLIPQQERHIDALKMLIESASHA